MAPRSSREITGLVLAGGRGSRMGGLDKGWVDYEGRPLILAAVERFSPQVGRLLISANRNVERYKAITGVAQVVVDEDSNFEGPLAGVLAAFSHVNTPWLAIMPCDAPHVPVDLVARLAGGLADSRAACARSGGLLQPLFALIASDAEPMLRRFYDNGGRSAKAWLQTIDAAAVEFEEDTAFRNINTISTAGRIR
jgi:molybdenum cofactor guanylyltransferase